MENPFVFGEVLDAQHLVDRRAELAWVRDALTTGGKLFLIGPRRYGKSSILRAAREVSSEATILLLNVEAYSDLNALASAIVVASAKATSGPLEIVGQTLRAAFSRLRPELSYDLTQNTWSATLGVAGNAETGATNLVEALNGLEALAHTLLHPLGLALDEFPRVVELGGAASEAQIRAAIQLHSKVGYVFAGSKTRVLSDMISNAERPFYRLGSALFLGEIPRPDFGEYLAQAFAQSGFSIEEAAIETLLDLAADVPYNVQLLAHTVWNQALESRVVTATLVEASLDVLCAQSDPFYSQLWLLLTPIQGKVLQLVLEQGSEGLFGQSASRKVGKNPTAIQRALSALQDKDVLRLETRGGSASWKLEDPFFGAWIKRTSAPL